VVLIRNQTPAALKESKALCSHCFCDRAAAVAARRYGLRAC
jgi:hypothetical protein